MRYFYKLGSIYITMKMNYQQLAKKRKSARNMLVDVLKSMVILECGEIILTSTIKSI